MKRFFALFLAVVIISASFASCAPKNFTVDECCEAVIDLMKEMLSSEEYVKMYGSVQAYSNAFEKVKGGDYSKPSKIYELTFSEEELWEKQGVDINALSEDLKEYTVGLLYNSVATLILQTESVASVAAMSAFTAVKSFVCDEIEGGAVYLYAYENGYPILITFAEGESNSVRVAARFLVSDSFDASDVSKTASSFERVGIKSVIVREK